MIGCASGALAPLEFGSRMPLVPGSTVEVRGYAPLVLTRMVCPAPAPRKVMPLCTISELFTVYVPAASCTTCPAGQLSSAA